MQRATNTIDLEAIGIGEIRSKRAAIGAFMLQIPGPEGHARADALAVIISVLFADKGDMRIARPSKRADIRVRDLDDAAIVEDIVSAVAVFGGCGPGDVKGGAIRPRTDHLGTLWVQCPFAPARKVVDRGRPRIG
ncbi:uncharacterized protein LOC116844026 [Odontomachus brunneus]|uniref:uncharacterized protein LOC116844026 n=1 Tax=Odontomachus brunneus TaxID=486640 RepID=UPI0013F2558C|nr:uncharacterized protein LOC116844026 [Odontomachus brunneus]